MHNRLTQRNVDRMDRPAPNCIFVGVADRRRYRPFRGQVRGPGKVTWQEMEKTDIKRRAQDLAPSAIAQHPRWEDTLFIAAGCHVLRSVDGGANWEAIGETLPNAKVTGMEVRDRDASLFLGSHGRGLYRRFI